VKLSLLEPVLSWSPSQTSYTHQLSFNCPTCGPPYKILVNVVLGNDLSKRPDAAWLLTFGNPTDWNSASVVPSIVNHNHGRKKKCSFHGTITSGEVTFET
jgi:hypothetical protein